MVVNVARAATDPAHAVVARVPAGCSPVRAAVSPDGARLYVTARASYALVVFDTAKLLSGAAHSQLAKFYVGPAPVPVAVIDGGKRVLVGNSNRLAESPEPQSLSVIDAARIGEGEAAVVGSIPAGSFPREMAVSADGRTLFLTNYTSHTLQVIDLDRLPMTPAGH
jgi:DNA-binding beta-propeller fold protein YncE